MSGDSAEAGEQQAQRKSILLLKRRGTLERGMVESFNSVFHE